MDKSKGLGVVREKNNENTLFRDLEESRAYVGRRDWPMISIITPTYNQGEYIEETILSVIEQNYPNLEYIIIDGGSSDKTIEVIKKYEQHISYWISESDRGQADAINKGLNICKGDIIGWLNSDDLLEPEALLNISDKFIDFNTPLLIAGSGVCFDDQGIVWQPDRLSGDLYAQEYTKLMLLQCWKYSLHQPSTYWNRALMDEIGNLNDSLHFAMDLEYWLRVIDNKIPIYKFDASLSKFRVHNTSKTNNEEHRLHQDLLTLAECHLSEPDLKKYTRKHVIHFGCYKAVRKIIQKRVAERRLFTWWQAFKVHPLSVIESPRIMLSGLCHALLD